MKKITLLILLVIAHNAYSQKDTITDHVLFSGYVTDFESSEDLDNFSIRVIMETDLIFEFKFEETSKYGIMLPYGFDYTIIYYAKNYVARQVKIDVSNIPMATDFIHELDLDLGLVKKKKGRKTRGLSKMVTSIARFSPTKNKVEWLSHQKDRIDSIISKRISAKNY